MPVVVLAGLALRASEQMRPWAVCWALEASVRDMRRTISPHVEGTLVEFARHESPSLVVCDLDVIKN